MGRPGSVGSRRRPLLATNPTYRTWFLGDSIAQAGRAVSSFAFPLILLSLGGGTIVVGTLQSAMIVVSVASILPLGHIVDRFRRARILLICALTACAVYATLSVLIATGHAAYGPLLAGALCAIIATQGANLAIDSMLRSLVSGSDFVSASALEEGRGSIIGLAGAPVGGFLYSLNSALPFIANALGNLGLATAALKLRGVEIGRHTQAAPERTNPSGRRRLPVDGFRLMHEIPGILPLIASNAFFNLMFTGSVSSIIYVWGRQHLDPFLIGLLSTCMLAGSLLGSMIVTPVLSRWKGRTVVLTASIGCVAMVSLAAVHATYASVLVAFSLANLMLPSANAVLGGYMSASVPEAAQGRVGAAAELVATLVAPLGPLLAGFLVHGRGLSLPLVLFALLGATGIAIQLASRSMTAIGYASEWERT